jgi:hypothetical protein
MNLSQNIETAIKSLFIVCAGLFPSLSDEVPSIQMGLKEIGRRGGRVILIIYIKIISSPFTWQQRWDSNSYQSSVLVVRKWFWTRKTVNFFGFTLILQL